MASTTQVHDRQQTQRDVTQSLVDHEMATHCQLPALYSPSPPEPAIPSEPGGLSTSEPIPAGNPGTSESGKTPPELIEQCHSPILHSRRRLATSASQNTSPDHPDPENQANPTQTQIVTTFFSSDYAE